MKAMRVLIVLIYVLMISGCNYTQINYSDTYIFGQDHQYNYAPHGEGGVCESKDGLYFLSGPSFGFLYFYDKANKKSAILCNKPNCLHADDPDDKKRSECNAYLGDMPEYIAYNQNYIYYVLTEIDFNTMQDVTSLYRLSLDGIGRRKLYTFKDQPERYTIHRGFLYYSVMIEVANETDRSFQLSHYSLCRLNLATPGEEPEVLDEGQEQAGSIGLLIGYGNDIYYQAGYYTDNKLESFYGCIKKCNIQTKTTAVFLENKASQFTVFSGKFIYSIWKDKTYAYDLDDGNIAEIYGQFGFCFSNGKYLFIDSDFVNEGSQRVVTVVDKDFNIVKQIDVNDFSSEPMGCSSEYYFLYKEDPQGIEQPSLYGIPADEIREDMTPILLH